MKSKTDRLAAPRSAPLLALGLGLLGALFGSAAFADAGFAKDWGPKHGFTAGGGLAYANAGAHGIAGGAEVTYFRRLRAPIYGWATAGYRVRAASQTAHLPYLEAGATLFALDLGLGLAPVLGSGRGTPLLVSGFAGLNIPVYRPVQERVFFAEPYYRLGTAVGSGASGASHELGVMLKIFWAFPAD